MGNEDIDGGDGDDTIYGEAGDDILYGEGGDDCGPGKEIIYGGPGDDLLDGNQHSAIHPSMGLDTLYGNEGADTFMVRSDGSHIIISDFEPGTDLMWLAGRSAPGNFNQLEITLMGNSTHIATQRGDLLAILPEIEPGELTAGDFV